MAAQRRFGSFIFNSKCRIDGMKEWQSSLTQYDTMYIPQPTWEPHVSYTMCLVLVVVCSLVNSFFFIVSLIFSCDGK